MCTLTKQVEVSCLLRRKGCAKRCHGPRNVLKRINPNPDADVIPVQAGMSLVLC